MLAGMSGPPWCVKISVKLQNKQTKVPFIYCVFNREESIGQALTSTLSEALGLNKEVLSKASITSSEGFSIFQLHTPAYTFCEPHRGSAPLLVVTIPGEVAVPDEKLDQLEALPDADTANPTATSDQSIAAAYYWRICKMVDQHRAGITLGALHSDSKLGKHVKATSVKVSLVTIAPHDRTTAQHWVEQARIDWAAVTTGTLAESGRGGVQEVFNKLINIHNSTAGHTYRLEDTHSSTSVCGELKPGVICYCNVARLPTTTVLMLELTGQGPSWNANSHIGQVYQYGVALLEQLPPTVRESVLVAVTDLRAIQFVRVIRDMTGQYRCEMSEEMAEVLPALCALFRRTPDQCGALTAPDLRGASQPLQVCGILGAGATSVVYKCSNCTGDAFAVKVSKDAEYSLEHEHKVLQSDAISKDAAPTACELLSTNALVMQPVGEPLTADMLMHRGTRVHLAMRTLIDMLQSCHSSWVHRDIRPDNLMWVDGKLFLIDWGFAVAPGKPELYSGTIRYASTRVLDQLMAAPGRAGQEQRVVVEPADDLVSLVLSLFALKHPAAMRRLHEVDCGVLAEVKVVWAELLRDLSMWEEAVQAAQLGQYADVCNRLYILLQ